MDHVRGAPHHPQTQGKIERWHQTMKNRVLLENYFLPDRKTPVEGEYFCISFGETKDSFVPERSTGVKKNNPAVERWTLTFGKLADDEVAVTGAALSGPELWLEPSSLRQALTSDSPDSAINDHRRNRIFQSKEFL